LAQADRGLGVFLFRDIYPRVLAYGDIFSGICGVRLGIFVEMMYI
jgi:hypothetical protein